MYFHYYSAFVSKTTAGVMQNELSADSDELTIPVNFKEAAIYGLAWKIKGIMAGWTDPETLKIEQLYHGNPTIFEQTGIPGGALGRLFRNYGHTGKRVLKSPMFRRG